MRVCRSVNGDSDEPVRRSYEDLRSEAGREIAALEQRLNGRPVSPTPSPDSSGVAEDLMVSVHNYKLSCYLSVVCCIISACVGN